MFPLPSAPLVPQEELASRLQRIRDAMTEAGVTHLVLTARTNVEYLSGYSTLTWAYEARPLILVVSTHDLVLVAPQSDERNIASTPQVFQSRLYRGYVAQAVDAVLDIVREIDPAGRGVAAIDYGQDHAGRGNLALVSGLMERGFGSRLISGSDLIWRVRTIKSRFEAELKRASFAIVNAAFDEVIQATSIGVSERELQRALQADIIDKGAERADPITMLFGRGDFIYNRPAGDRRLEVGDYLWTDFRSTYGGYPADRNRIARAGEPQAWERALYRDVRALTLEVCAALRPGMPARDLYDVFSALWSQAALGTPFGLVGRIGHGGGLGVTEPPSISADSDEIIQAGMILHIEPKLERDGAVFQFEEVLYVTEEDVEFLSALSPAEIPVVW